MDDMFGVGFAAAQPDAGSGGGARAQFEAWATGEGLNVNIYPHNGLYNHPVTRGAWMAWQHLAASQPVGVEPVAYRYRDGKYWGYCDRAPVDPDITGEPLYAAPPAPAAVPVDGGIAFRLTALRSSLAETPDFAEQAEENDAANNIGVDLKTLDEIITDLIATHPQPAAAGGDA